jgi:CRP-like cAMP-binding protein
MTDGLGTASPAARTVLSHERSAVSGPTDRAATRPFASTLDRAHVPLVGGNPVAASAAAASHIPLEEHNWLLRTLRADEYAAVRPHLERVRLTAGQRLASPAGGPAYVYFPQSGVVSILRRARDGSDVEVATVGAEGMSALTALPNDEPPCECLVRVEGVAHRVRDGALRALAREHGPLHAVVPRFSQYLFSQAAQSVVCARRHRVEQQCARWLLTMHDRLAGDEIALTHDLVAAVLGVRRASVSGAFAVLQRLRAVETGRGRVTVTDRAALEAASCECYHSLRNDLASLLGPLHRHVGPT